MMDINTSTFQTPETMLAYATVDDMRGPVTACNATDWPGLCGMVTAHQVAECKDGPAWIPGYIDPGQRLGARVKRWDVLVLDVEADAETLPDKKSKRVVGPFPPTLPELAAEIELRGLSAALATTHGHEAPIEAGTLGPRYRVVFKLTRPLAPHEIKPIGLAVAAILGIGDCLDTKCLEPARLFFLPRVPSDRQALAERAILDGKPLDVERLLAQAQQSNAVPTRRAGKASASVIDAFNAKADWAHILEPQGYVRKERNRWMWAGSTSGVPGVVLLPDSGRIYSHHGGDPLANQHSHDKFGAWCILFHGGDFRAAVNEAVLLLELDKCQPPGTGTRNVPAPDILEHDDPTTFGALDAIDDAAHFPIEEEKNEFPIHLLSPPGILGEIMDWILDCAQKPQPILALAASLSIVATVLAQKVKSQTGLRTNLYLVSVADTSAGKDHGRKCLKLAFHAAGLESMLGGEDLASGPGLLAAAKRNPRSVFQIDEFGLMLKSIKGNNAGAHLQQIITNLMKLFTSTSSTFTGTEYANQSVRPRADIPYPCVNVHATTTPEPLFEAFGSGDVASGNLNRLLILFAPTSRFPLRFTEVREPPAKVVEWMKTAYGLHQGELVGMTPDNPIKISMSEGATSLFNELYKFQQDKEHAKRAAGLHHLWGRCWVHSAKVAVVVACAKHDDPRRFALNIDQGQVSVDEDSAKWAIDFVKHVMGRMEYEVSTRVADSEFGQTVQESLRFIHKAGAKGLTERELGRNYRKFKGLMPGVRDAVLEIIQRNEDAKPKDFPSSSGRGRNRQAWVASEFWSLCRHVPDVERD